MGENRGFPQQSRVYSEVVQLYLENLKSILVSPQEINPGDAADVYVNPS
jgi:hypothetical protein